MLQPQVGEYNIVLEVGRRVLETWESRQFRRDVLLSMALAHCGLASDEFEKQAVASGCGLMIQGQPKHTTLASGQTVIIKLVPRPNLGCC